ncbi:DUF2802 domain-containing protein [Deefgea sp. CFH1-16]|uniref:DUF2802 domain-containing protein n=1 Tax=Deefgea sp. CFH1-16 TaxID=2675457 RepID=UPI0015F7793D|nr:DUF2802 domain-containing protein [Deefgea sp. CFH1-16]
MSQSLIGFSWEQLLYLGLIFFLFYVLELLFFWYKYNKQKEKYKINATVLSQLDALEQEVQFLKVKLASLTSLLRPEQLNASLPDSAFNPPPQNATESPYAHAIRLAQTGADAPEVAASCGISRGEADLIVAIYRSAERN